MGDQREASVGHRAQELTPGGGGGEEKSGRGETEEEETHSAKQDFQSQPVIGCGISIVQRRAGETKGGRIRGEAKT